MSARFEETLIRHCAATLACDSVICQDEPDEQALAECEKLGQALVS